jgi:hypothetical protein
MAGSWCWFVTPKSFLQSKFVMFIALQDFFAEALIFELDKNPRLKSREFDTYHRFEIHGVDTSDQHYHLQPLGKKLRELLVHWIGPSGSSSGAKLLGRSRSWSGQPHSFERLIEGC